MVSRENNEWGTTHIWHGRTLQASLPETSSLSSPAWCPPFLPFLLAILEKYDIQAIHLHPKFIALLAVFAYACEAWVGIKPSVAYFRHLFALRSSGLN
jgi:hypothetical protein